VAGRSRTGQLDPTWPTTGAGQPDRFLSLMCHTVSYCGVRNLWSHLTFFLKRNRRMSSSSLSRKLTTNTTAIVYQKTCRKLIVQWMCMLCRVVDLCKWTSSIISQTIVVRIWLHCHLSWAAGVPSRLGAYASVSWAMGARVGHWGTSPLDLQ